MVIPVNPGNKIDAHVARVRDEWGGGGGGDVQDVRVVDQPVMVQSTGTQTVYLGGYSVPLHVDIFSAQAVVPVRTDQPTSLGGFDLAAANSGGGAWVRYLQISNRWRGGDPSAHGVWACVRHQNMAGGDVEIRLAIELPSSFSLESKIVIPTSPNDQFVSFPAPTIVGAPPEWQEQLLPIFWQDAWLEVRVPAGYSTGDLYLFFTHSVE